MKCINKREKSLSSKKQSIRRKRVRKTWILIGVFGGILALGFLSVALLMKKNTLSEPFPYDRSTRMNGTQVQERALKADGKVGDLCVGAQDTAMEGIDRADGELAALFDLKDKSIPFSEGLYEKTSPGKVSQLMTALLACETLDMNTEITIEPEDIVKGSGTSTCGLTVGDTVLAKQLLNAVLVASADDAARALARTSKGSSEAFTDAMNQKAAELGMTDTQFTNPTGAQDEEQYTTVYDVYLLLNALLEYPELINSMRLPNYTMNYNRAGKDARQQWLDSDNFYVTGRVPVPKGVTVLGGKMMESSSENYTVLLVQNNYGDTFAAILLKSADQSSMYIRINQMLEQINS